MSLQELGEKLTSEFEKGGLSPRVFLDRLAVLEEASRKTAAYQDPRYVPFYYHLSKFIKPQNFIEIGFGLGFSSSCFFAGCDSVKKFLAFETQTEEFYSPRLALANIKRFYQGEVDFYRGLFTDGDFIEKLSQTEWDLLFLNDEMSLDNYRNQLDLLWDHTKLDGLIVVNYTHNSPADEAFNTFCKIVNRKPVFFKTRYGTGIVQK